MKVRELIAGSRFVQGAARREAAPLVTVILPTFRRGDSGLLRRCLDSLTQQSFDDLEIIVVDDASVDSSAQVIADAMARDPRISVIRHAANIGLPAVSEYEGYLRARGELISFAFDDTVFAPDGLEHLVAANRRTPGAMIVGHVRYFSRDADGELHDGVLGKDAEEADLLAGNPIPNGGVLVPRAVLEDVGLYDPHISLARVCDYDLWLRVRRHHPIEFIDVCVGEEYGPATSDSLGSTYPLDHWIADDRMRTERDELLRPEVFGEVDVFESASFASGVSRRVVERRSRDHVALRPWMSQPEPVGAAEARVPRVIVLGHPLSASVQLVFEAMRDVRDIHVRCIDRASWSITELAGCDALIVARDFAAAADWSAAAIALGIPVYYYLDDDIPRMFTSGELDERWGHFAPSELRRALHGFTAVLASTPELAASFREQGIHDTVDTVDIAVPVSISRRSPTRRAGDGVTTIALFAGEHRVAGFLSTVLPAVSLAAERTGRPVRVLVPSALLESVPSVAALVRVEGYPTSADYFVALRTLGLRGVDTLVVPPSSTGNQPYKSIHPLLSAAVLGARLLVPDAAPYRSLATLDGVLLVEDADEVAAWQRALEALLATEDSIRVPTVASELATTRFDAVANARRLHDIVAPTIGPPIEIETRLASLTEWFARQLAHSRNVGLNAGPSGEPAAEELLELYRVVKTARRLHVATSWRGPLAIADAHRLEKSVPLHLVSYLEYRVRLAVGAYSRLTLPVIGPARPGDIIGVEVVGPTGDIELHTVAALSAGPGARDVVFEFPRFRVELHAEYLLRVFATTRHPVAVMERVSRRLWGAARPRVRLQFALEAEAPS